MNLLQETLARIGDLDTSSMEAARERQKNLLKPPGSLGVLEELSIQLAGIYATSMPVIGQKKIIVMGADHGVVAEGVSAFPQFVTAVMMPLFAQGKTGVSVLAKHVGASLAAVDIGVAAPIDDPGVLNKNIRKGTGNMVSEPAMSREEAVESIEIGIKVAQEAIDAGVTLLGTGDMGIGNTTPSSAILAVLGGFSPQEVTGRGTGINDETLNLKTEMIEKAIAFNKPDKNDPLDVLAKVGGLEIGGIAGIILAAAANRIPVVIDGFISSAGALVAASLSAKSVQFMIPSHCSAEQAHRLMLETIGLRPMLDMKMRLGEGTGAALAMSIVDGAIKVLRDMGTFADIGM